MPAALRAVSEGADFGVNRFTPSPMLPGGCSRHRGNWPYYSGANVTEEAMNLPGFTAQASLYRTTNRYRSSGSGCGDLRLGEPIVPQLLPKDAPGPLGCLSDCRDEHPNWTSAQCHRYCFGSREPPPPPLFGGQTPESDPVQCLFAMETCKSLLILCMFGWCSPFNSCMDFFGCSQQ